ncbi:hypothetical protein NDU88_000799 [Pleurodeles waltl]|uniref:Uncharacterized protein n=1 Tax=Pleurodeles waltl TaxID=8319 RepID=A0AAV7VX27_PLEWA|nr:hypothetical protein NDU88_000799 [Pleurodeles waltl]
MHTWTSVTVPLIPVPFLIKPHCSQLSNKPAQDASDWRCPRGVHKGDNGLPRFLDDETASTLENPDIRVPTGTKREDGLQGDVEEDAEEADSEENTESPGDREEKEDADWRHGNSRGPRGVAEEGRRKPETRLQPTTPQEGHG